MRIDIKETIVLTQKEQEFFNDMVDFIDAIYEESEKGGSIENASENMIELLEEISTYVES